MQTNIWKPLLLGCLLLPLTACQTTGTQGEEEGTVSVEDRAAAASLPDDTARARALGAPSGAAGTWQGKSIDDPTSPISKRVIYFDYDSDEVKDEYKPTLEAHAAYLSEKKTVTAALEGHTDERGSREYNLGLGERRAQSVKRVMTVYGASAGQIRTVSWGEEKPEADGDNESAWALNRRVVIVYGSR